MSKKDIPAMVESLALPIAQELGLELVDVEFAKEGTHWYLRIFLDRDGGLEVEDCCAMSDRLSSILDEKDPIPQAYMLEVSSPGLERPLKKKADFIKYADRLVRVKAFNPIISGEKEVVAKLRGLDNEDVVLSVDNQELKIPLEKVASIRLEIEF